MFIREGGVGVAYVARLRDRAVIAKEREEKMLVSVDHRIGSCGLVPVVCVACGRKCW